MSHRGWFALQETKPSYIFIFIFFFFFLAIWDGRITPVAIECGLATPKRRNEGGLAKTLTIFFLFLFTFFFLAIVVVRPPSSQPRGWSHHFIYIYIVPRVNPQGLTRGRPLNIERKNRLRYQVCIFSKPCTIYNAN
jgi:hypothetical protein